MTIRIPESQWNGNANAFRDPTEQQICEALEAGFIYFPLNQGVFTLIDIGDVSLVAGLSWRFDKRKGSQTLYAVSTGYCPETRKGNTISMHRVIMHAPLGVQVDHINGNGLDNRKENLRLCQDFQNKGNMPKRTTNPCRFKGVRKRNNRYAARIGYRGKQYHLGSFTTDAEAAIAYNAAAVQFYGEFARINIL